jgi:hypothetical protein
MIIRFHVLGDVQANKSLPEFEKKVSQTVKYNRSSIR